MSTHRATREAGRTVGHCSAQHGRTAHPRNNTGDLGDTALSEISQSQKETLCDPPRVRDPEESDPLSRAGAGAECVCQLGMMRSPAGGTDGYSGVSVLNATKLGA